MRLSVNRVCAVGLIAAFLLCNVSFQVLARDSSTGSKVQLVTRDGGLSAIVDNQEVSLHNPNSASNRVQVHGVDFSPAQGGGIEISSSAGQVSISSSEAKGWRAEIPQSVPVEIKADLKNGQIELSMPKGNGGAGFLLCDDGSQIELKGGAKGHLDLLSNGAFVFKGSGNIMALDADGHAVNLSVPGASMTGGALQLRVDGKDADGKDKSHWERPGAAMSLTIEGMQGGELKISADGGKMYTAPTTIETPTGSIGFKLNADGSLNVSAAKGKFQILVSGVPGFMVTATSGQQAQLLWDKSKKLAEIKNLCSEPMQVSLPGRSVAVVEPNVEFQYALVAKGIFSTAAAGGRVKLYNGNGNDVGSVETGGMLLDSKRLIAGLTSGAGIRLKMNWDNGQPLQAFSALAFAQVEPGSERIVSFGSDGRAKIMYSAGGFLTLEALRSNFQLVIDAIHGLTINVVEGDKVSLTLDLKKGTFTLKTGADNINDVSVETENGYSPVLQADRALNFNIGDLNGWVIGANGEINPDNPSSPTSPFTSGLLPPSPSTPFTEGLIPPPVVPPPQPGQTNHVISRIQ